MTYLAIYLVDVVPRAILLDRAKLFELAADNAGPTGPIYPLYP